MQVSSFDYMISINLNRRASPAQMLFSFCWASVAFRCEPLYSFGTVISEARKSVPRRASVPFSNRYFVEADADFRVYDYDSANAIAEYY